MIHPIVLMGATILTIYILIRQFHFWKLVLRRVRILRNECVFRIIERDNYHIKLQCVLCDRVDTFYNLEAKPVE